MTARGESNLLIVAGEVSGDIHAGNLLDELKRLRPGVEAFGVGGERLIAAGLEPVASIDELAHMGLVEVLRELPRIRRLMHRLVDQAARRRPALAVLVDSPDFNLRLASRLRRLGVPVVLYVSPQLWAWRRGRVRTVRRLAREVLCLLPFEVPFYEAHGVRSRYVGHPLVDEIARVGLLDRPREVVSGRIALLPGSREMEVTQLLPVMIETLRRLPPAEVSEAVLVEAPGVERLVDSVLARTGTDPRVIRVRGEQRRFELARSALAWTASGTATLECALLDVPMVVGYRLRGLTYALARLLVSVPNVALVNLIADKTIAPELLQKEWRPDRLAAVTSDLLLTGGPLQRDELAVVRQRLGERGASRNAAEAIAEHLDATGIG
jgi:lipid-A-disaccharide synthase